jgi:3-phosphoglycerate kinase
MKEGDIILLENLRIYKEEEENNEEFAQKLSLFGEIYINDAFGCCHRAHASIVGIPKYLPAGAGLLLEKEIKILTEILEKPERPLVVIIGGIKIETKTKVIENFLKIADHLLLGSKIGEVILIAKGILVGRKFNDEKLLEKIKEIDLTSQKLHLPVDGQMSLATLDEKYFRVGGIGTVRKEEEIFDIGPETIDIFSKIIKEAKTIIWNGPLGYFERPPFDMGTKKIVEAIIKNHRAFKVAGGGETDSFLHQSGLREKFDYVSTGGGAFLEFLSGKKLPGIEALE